MAVTTSRGRSSKPITVALIHANDGSDVRIGKFCRTLCELGYDCHFIGWDRRPNETKPRALGDTACHVMSLQTRHGRGTLWGLFRFYLFAIYWLFRVRPLTVSAVNEDLAFAFVPFRRLLFRRLVCDVFDSLKDRHSNKGPVVRRLISAVSWVARSGADRLVATDHRRLARFEQQYQSKSVVIENYPEDCGPNLSKTSPDGPLKVFVSGSLSQSRGLAQIVASASRVGNTQLISVGWIYDDYTQTQFVTNPLVSYHGIVTAKEALELGASCDAFLVFYEPTNLNNRNASPNKIYDALSVGRPCIVNREASISAWIEQQDLGFVCEYDAPDQLDQIVRRLQDRSDHVERSQRLRSVFEQGYCWSQFGPVIDELFRGVD